MRRIEDRLADITEAIDAIDRIAVQGQAAFYADRMIQVWMLHHLQIIGEAVRAISTELTKRRPNLPWAQIVGMRTILVHDYFGIDLDQVWQVVAQDLPKLKPEIKALLEEIRQGRENS